MKALSVRQPYAWLLSNSLKDVENRTWKTKYRGRFFIHASLSYNHSDWTYVEERHGLILPRIEEMEVGGIVGVADLVDCVTEHESPWFEGPNAFVIENAAPLPFVRCRGALGLWEIEAGQVLADLEER